MLNVNYDTWWVLHFTKHLFLFPAVFPCVFSRTIGERESICENELSVTLNNDYIDNSITTSSQNKFKLKDEHDNILTGTKICFNGAC